MVVLHFTLMVRDGLNQNGVNHMEAEDTASTEALRSVQGIRKRPGCLEQSE